MATLGSSPPKAPEAAPNLGPLSPGRERAPTVPQAGGGNPGYFTSEDLLVDDTLPMLDRVVKYATAQMALQRLVHVRMLGTAAAAVGPRATLDRLIPLLPALAVDQEFVVRKELAALRKTKLGVRQLHNIKQQIVGHVALSQDSGSSVMTSLGKSFLLYNRVERLETVFEAIEAITAEDVLRLANEVLDDRTWSHLVYANA